MDWDDEDEQTTIYDKAGEGDAAKSLLQGSVPPPPIPAAGMPAPSMPPGRVPAPGPPTRPINRPPVATPPPMSHPSQPMMPVPAMAPVAPLAPRRDRRSGTYVAAAVAAVVALVAFGLIIALWPHTGSLVVTVSGPGNKPLDAVEILVNGDRKCSSSPCTIDGLKADTYYVRAHAAGYQAMADIAVVVNSGGKAVQNLTLVRALGTGVKVIGEGTGLKLFVDGREVGPLPQEIKDMEPGDHVIKVAGSDRLEPFEKRVTVEAEQMQTIGPVRLRVLKGLATITPGTGADGAKVILFSGSDRRTLPKLPITLDIPTNQPHTLVATRHGYDQFRMPIKFDDGQVEKTFEVVMPELGTAPAQPVGTDVAPAVHHIDASSMLSPSPSPTPVVAAPTSSVSSAGAGAATLNINSIPVSNIILDGRPVGATPKVGVHVNAGTHTVVFVKGTDRKSASVTVAGGQTRTVAVRF